MYTQIIFFQINHKQLIALILLTKHLFPSSQSLFPHISPCFSLLTDSISGTIIFFFFVYFFDIFIMSAAFPKHALLHLLILPKRLISLMLTLLTKDLIHISNILSVNYLRSSVVLQLSIRSFRRVPVEFKHVR